MNTSWYNAECIASSSVSILLSPYLVPFFKYTYHERYNRNPVRKIQMKSREIQDSQNIRWQCVQAFTGINSKTADQAERASLQSDGTVEVVCTPSGGAQTVRLKLSQDWDSTLSDTELEKCIVNEKRDD